MQSQQWVEGRAESAEHAIELRIKLMLKQFISIAGRWDLESLKLTLMQIQTEMEGTGMTA